ncbi:MAG: glycoside hydrolase family 3 N-terminal domain-containing protein, partial [Acidobacteriota bacterium]
GPWDRTALRRELIRQIRRAHDPPPLVGIDHEGGRVSRLSPPFPSLPSPSRLGRLEMPGICRWFAALIGRGLRSLGIQVDFAPVLDLSTEDARDGIGDRAFSADPRMAARHAQQFLLGLREAGVAGCLKHFPGLGGAPGDTHQTLPRMPADPSLHEAALKPFRMLANQAVQVMVAHAHYPGLSGESPLPASLDRRIVYGLLREEIGFRGVILSDDLEMEAVCRRAPFGELAVQAIRAGSDQILICHRADRITEAHEALRRAARSGDLDPVRLEASLRRVETLHRTPACGRPVEPFDQEEFDLVLHEMSSLTGEVDRALRRQQ